MKTTGVSDIPKFGLLDFLGHPTAHLADRPVNLLSDRLPIALKVAAHGVPLFDVVHPGEEVEQGLERE